MITQSPKAISLEEHENLDAGRVGFGSENHALSDVHWNGLDSFVQRRVGAVPARRFSFWNTRIPAYLGITALADLGVSLVLDRLGGPEQVPGPTSIFCWR